MSSSEQCKSAIDISVVTAAGFHVGELYSTLPSEMLNGEGPYTTLASARAALDAQQITNGQYEQFKDFAFAKTIMIYSFLAS